MLQPKNLITKKKALKNFQGIKQTNTTCYQLLEYLKDKYTFSDEERKEINLMQNHVLNMNVIFTDMEKVIK